MFWRRWRKPLKLLASRERGTVGGSPEVETCKGFSSACARVIGRNSEVTRLDSVESDEKVPAAQTFVPFTRRYLLEGGIPLSPRPPGAECPAQWLGADHAVGRSPVVAVELGPWERCDREAAVQLRVGGPIISPLIC